jgi:hypothetical protein
MMFLFVNICKYMVICIIMVITFQNWSLGGQLQYFVQQCCANFLQEQQGVDNASLNTETHYYAIITNEGLFRLL